MSIIAIVACVLAINLTVDAFGILRTDFSRQFQLPNMNVIKMKYLLMNPQRFDSFIFGSSRVGNIDPRKIADGSCYNMIYPLGLPEEHLRNIRYLLEQGVGIKNLLVGIDEFSFTADPAPRRSDLLSQPLPAISGKPLETFYGEYYLKLRNTMPQLRKFILYNYTDRDDRAEHRFIYDIYESGRILCPSCDEDLAKPHQRRKFVPDQNFNQGDYVEQTLGSISEIVQLAKDHHIRLTLFINPTPEASYRTADLVRFGQFKRKLAAISDYYDFSGMNSITTDTENYYEILHFRPFVGDMMLDVMFGSPKVKVPADFGFHVTLQNVDRHLYEQCRDLTRVKSAYDLPSVNKAYADSCSLGTVRGR